MTDNKSPNKAAVSAVRELYGAELPFEMLMFLDLLDRQARADVAAAIKACVARTQEADRCVKR